MDIQAMKADMKKETTLGQIAEDPGKLTHNLLFGVVIDISEPQKYQENDNYVVSIKIIDPSFNYQTKVQNDRLKFHKFVQIYVYSEDPQNLPKVQYIGDIIRLRRFKFFITKKGSLIGSMQKFSNWLVYPGANFKERETQCDPWVSILHKNLDKNLDRQLYSHEKGRLEDLRKWSVNFFQQNSITYIDWWNNFTPTGDSKNAQEVDMFLKVGAIDPKKKQVIFYDYHNNSYKAIVKNLDIKSLNHIIKLRCVNINVSQKKGQKKFKIDFTDKSSGIFLPSYSLDYQKFFQKISDKKTHTLLEFYEWLANYDLEHIQVKNNKITPKKHLKSKIITTYRKIVSKKNKTAQELHEILKKPGMYKNERFTFEGRIVNMNEDNPKNFLKVMQIQSKKFFDFKSFKFGPNLDKKYRVFIHLQVQVLDEKSKKPIEIYISTTEGDHHLFETWEIIPPSDRIQEWSKLTNSQLTQFQTTLQALKNPQNKVKLCLQLMTTSNGKSFFKLVDTIFLPL